MSIKIIGVTGPSGAGKSCLSTLFSEKGLPVIDADKVYHSLLKKDSECTKALVGEFGAEILNENGEPDTKKLGAIVFCSDEKLKRLNSLVLGLVIKEINGMISRLDADGHSAVAVDAPTLIESGFSKECDCVISILASAEKRIERICLRDNISHEKALMRVNAQKKDDFYISNSDLVITNDGSTSEFFARAKEALREFLDN